MFGWFHPTCPLDSYAKKWVEQRLQWLAVEFGLEVFTHRPVILPLQKFFPDRYDASDETVRSLLDRVCGYMDVDPLLVDLRLFTDRQDVWLVDDRGKYIPREAGLYENHRQKTVIHLETSQLDTPLDLVGTMAHELAHQRLMGEHRVADNIFDNELLTDLTVVFHGLGIFLANSPRAWKSDFSTWPWTTVRRPEYMTLSMFGYALAHMAWFRNERKPSWVKYLRPDARATFRQSLRYLWETGDSHFKPEHAE